MIAQIRARGLAASPTALRGALVVALAVLWVAALTQIPLGGAVDWDQTFKPAVLAWLSGGNPYTVEPHPLFNPPWVLLPLVPFAVLPQAVGRAALLAVSLTAFAIAAKRFGASPIAMALFLAAIPTWDSYILGNVEWLVALGLIVPRPAGMLLLAIKPQASIAVMAFYAAEAVRSGGLRGLVRLLLPLAIVTALSFVVFGAWPLESLHYLQFRESTMNYSFFPRSTVPGVALVIAAMRRRDVRFAMAASPMFFPVVTPEVWTMAFLPLVSMPLELAGAVVMLLLIALSNGGPI